MIPVIDEPAPLDRDALINEIYRTQTTLKLYVDLLIRERHPIIHPTTMMTLSYINDLIHHGQRFRLH